MFMVCAKCSDGMFLAHTDLKPISTTHYQHIYIITCENNHKIEVEGSAIKLDDQSPMAQKIIKFLLEKSEQPNENNSN